MKSVGLQHEFQMLYHRIYHYSFGLHLNHLVFLNSYMFGVMLFLASIGFYSCIIAGLLLYFLYVLILCSDCRFMILFLLPYIMFLGGLAHGAWFLQDYLSAQSMLERKLIALFALGIILISFISQLIGHWVHEVFNAPPSLMHGFVAAPVLEYISLLWRCGFGIQESSRVLKKVEEIRDRAFRSHCELLFGSGTRDE